MHLTEDERRMLAGEEGEAARWAIEQQLAVGDYFGAERLIPVTHAHIVVNVEVMGQAGCDLLGRFAEGGARFGVPCSTNAQPSVRSPFAPLLGQDLEMLADQERVDSLLSGMGALVLNSCTPYQCSYQPHFGEHVAWGDTGAVCYSNSVFGSRSNFEAGAASLAAALTGRVPAYGYHLDHRRRATAFVRVEADLDDLADWGALGAVVGTACGNYWEVPLLRGLPERVRPDELKHLAAALGSYGSMALFGIDGLTPEAAQMAQQSDRRGRNELHVGRAELEAVFDRWSPDREEVDVVVFSGPQLSLLELRMLAEGLAECRVSDRTELILTSNHGTLAVAERLGYLEVIRRAGALVMEGVCFYHLELNRIRERRGWKTVVTNSAKVANIIGTFDLQPVLRRTPECIQAAVTGKVP